ncbi:MAG: DNA repair protein RecN [bacterium]|nr:DNA repair protein RecN [bacterium]
MLRSISIRNLLLIDSLEIQFEKGFVVITGESGSGKSMVIRALSFLLESKLTSPWLKHNAETGFIEAVFQIISTNDSKNHSFPTSKEIVVRREVKIDNRSRCFINDELVTRNELFDTVKDLLHFSLQEDIGLLRDKTNQLDLLDHFGNLLHDRLKVEKAFQKVQQLKKHLDEVLLEYEKHKKETDWITQELKELESIQYQRGEKESLQEALKRLKNSYLLKDKIFTVLSKLGNEANSTRSDLNNAIQVLHTLVEFFPSIQECVNLLENASIELKEAFIQLENIFRKIQDDPNQLNLIETRLFQIHELERKWKINAEDIPNRIDILKQSHHQLNLLENKLSEIQKELEEANTVLLHNSKLLSFKREAVAKKLVGLVHQELPTVGIPNVQFDIIKTERSIPSSNGIDDIVFFFSANPDQPMVPLSNVISGGELSRLELVILSNIAHSKGKTFLFDEIDRGVSGKIAASIGRCLRKIANNNQIIIVSHLPQVAAAADQHIKIEKHLVKNITRITAKSLSYRERVFALAELLAGDKTGAGAIEGAKDLLKSFHKEFEWSDL